MNRTFSSRRTSSRLTDVHGKHRDGHAALVRHRVIRVQARERMRLGASDSDHSPTSRRRSGGRREIRAQVVNRVGPAVVDQQTTPRAPSARICHMKSKRAAPACRRGAACRRPAASLRRNPWPPSSSPWRATRGRSCATSVRTGGISLMARWRSSCRRPWCRRTPACIRVGPCFALRDRVRTESTATSRRTGRGRGRRVPRRPGAPSAGCRRSRRAPRRSTERARRRRRTPQRTETSSSMVWGRRTRRAESCTWTAMGVSRPKSGQRFSTSCVAR